MRLTVLCFFLACAYTMFGQDSIESYSYASDKIVELWAADSSFCWWWN